MNVHVCLHPTQKNTKAPQAGGKIHTDFEKGFIMAEVRNFLSHCIFPILFFFFVCKLMKVMKFEDFKELGSESAVKVRAVDIIITA